MGLRSPSWSWFALGLLALGPVAAQQFDTSSADVHAALEEVTRLRCDANAEATRLSRAVEQFRSCVRAAGPRVVEDELALVGSTDMETARRAQLVLAQVPTLPAGWSDRLGRDARWTAQLYAALRSHPTEPPGTGDAPGPAEGHDIALRAVAGELASRLALSDETLARCNPDFVVDYRRECVPRLAVPEKFVQSDDCSWTDLDGDGARELVVVCDSVWKTYWRHDVAFAAVIRVQDSARPSIQFSRLPSGGSVRARRLLDLDGDGTLEVVVWIDVMEGRAPASTLLAISRDGMASIDSYGICDNIRVLSVCGQPVIATNAGLDWTFPDGAAMERCGALASQHAVFRLETGKFKQVAWIWLPLARGTE